MTGTQKSPPPCPHCRAGEVSPLYHRPVKPGQGIEARMTTDVYDAYGHIDRCRNCGLVFRRGPFPGGEVLDAYARLEDPDFLEEAECRSMNAYLSLRTLKRHVKSGRLLDVGCAAGYFLNAARWDFETVGVEPSLWAARLVRERLKLDVRAATAAAASFPDGHFDAVTMVDVIEHLPAPWEELREMARILRPGGCLYLLTPDIDSLSARLLRGRWWGLRPAHLFYFSPRTLGRMLEDAGFEVREVKSYGRLFTYGYWLSRLRSYPRPFYALLGAVIRLFGLADKVVFINTRDSFEICAVKKQAGAPSSSLPPLNKL